MNSERASAHGELHYGMNPKISEEIPSADGARVRRRRPDAYVLSSDDALLLELGPLLGERFRSRPVDQIEDLPAESAVPWLAVIDATRPDARAMVHRIEQLHPRAPLVVVAADGQESSWQAAQARGSICAVVSLQQLSSPALREALDKAEKRLDAAPAPGTAEAPAIPGAPSGRRPALIIGAAVAVIAAAAVIWLVARDNKPAASAGRPKTEAAVRPVDITPGNDAAPAPQRSVFELLSDARVAFRDQDRLLPRSDGTRRGDSAVELYAQVLTQDPQNEEARDGLRRLFSVARSRMQTDLAAGRLDEARTMLAIFKSAGLEADATRALENDITAAQPKWLQVQTRRAISGGDLAIAEQLLTQYAATNPDKASIQELRRAIDARQGDQQLQGLGDEVRAAITAGNLLEPANNNARTRLLAMRQQNRNHPATVAAQRDLQEALLARARETQRAGQPDNAQRLLTSAAEFGTTAEITELRRQMQVEGEQVAAARIVAIAPPAPAPTAVVATPAASAAPGFIAAKPLRALNVTYPARASEIGQQGFVIVEFTLRADGSAADVGVAEASPAGVFDRAATDAVSRGRYDIAALGDSKQPRRARLKVTFKPMQSK
jgi:TonB family protein